MQRMMVGLLTGTVISGTTGAHTNVTKTQGPIAESTPAVAPAPSPVTAAKTWADHIIFKGDGRLRYDMINDGATKKAQGDDYTRDRARIRARLGAEGKVDNLKAGIGFSTGGVLTKF